MFVLHLRPARVKARDAAVAEVVALLRDLGGKKASGGPLAEQKGVAWVTVPADRRTEAVERLQHLGYVGRIDGVEPAPDGARRSQRHTRWRGRDVVLSPVYDEPDSDFRHEAPDARTFLLEGADGVVRPVTGYRGGSGPLEHRALPVVDARLLVNLVHAPGLGTLLDPFAGGGGVVLEAVRAGWSAVSLDPDPTLRHGLKAYGARHAVADAARLPFRDGSVDAVATEPPYHDSATDTVVSAVTEMARVLRPGARASLLVAGHQIGPVTGAGRKAGFGIELASPVNRKGTDVACVVMVRPPA